MVTLQRLATDVYKRQEKDLAIATEVARLFECKDHYELAALEFFRYLHALEKIQERLKDTPEIL